MCGETAGVVDPAARDDEPHVTARLLPDGGGTL
jgi:hypothetical protein